MEQNKPLLNELGSSNAVIVYTSCKPNQGTVTYPVPGGSGGSTQISHFHIYFMTALNGDRDISLNDVYKMIEKEKRSVTTPRRFCRPEGADSRVKISAVLRKPDKFKWYVVGAGPGGFKITFNRLRFMSSRGKSFSQGLAKLSRNSGDLCDVSSGVRSRLSRSSRMSSRWALGRGVPSLRQLGRIFESPHYSTTSSRKRKGHVQNKAEQEFIRYLIAYYQIQYLVELIWEY